MRALLLERSSQRATLGYSRVRVAQDAAVDEREPVLAIVRRRVLAFARRRLSPADAEDLTQEVMLLLATKYAHVSAPEELVALGVRSAALKAMAHWRKLARRRVLGEIELPAGDLDASPADRTPDDAPDAEAGAIARQRLALFIQAADQLDGRCREILRRKLEGASYVEIAAELGRPVNTVYSWDHRCHKRLRALLGSRWGFVSGQEQEAP